MRWLRYDLARGDDEDLQARLPDDSPAWSRLAEGLRLAHEEPCAPLRAREMIVGWVASHGPCHDHVDRGAAHERIIRMAHEQAFEEVPDGQEVEAIWADAHARWESTRRAVRARVGGGGGRQGVWQLRLASESIELRHVIRERTGSRPPGPGVVPSLSTPPSGQEEPDRVTQSRIVETTDTTENNPPFLGIDTSAPQRDHDPAAVADRSPTAVEGMTANVVDVSVPRYVAARGFVPATVSRGVALARDTYVGRAGRSTHRQKLSPTGPPPGRARSPPPPTTP